MGVKNINFQQTSFMNGPLAEGACTEDRLLCSDILFPVFAAFTGIWDFGCFASGILGVPMMRDLRLAAFSDDEAAAEDTSEPLDSFLWSPIQ